MRRLVVLFTGVLLVLAGCTAGNQKPTQVDADDAASELKLIDFYKGLHQVGVRLLAEDAGEGGRANLQRFNALYFTANEQQALKYLRMSLFADPFNVDNKAVAAQLESVDLFGLLSEKAALEDSRQVVFDEHESLPDISARVYGSEYYAVLLQRYNAQVNADYLRTRQLYAPDLKQLPPLDYYYQASTAVRPVAAPARRAKAAVSASTTLLAAEFQPVIVPDITSDQEAFPLIEEPLDPQQPTPQELYQQGYSVAAYRLLRNQSASERNQPLYDHLWESLIETPYREGVSHYHAHEVREAIEKFERVLSIDPEHLRARQYMERATRLVARISGIE